jgi:hypothetical protein
MELPPDQWSDEITLQIVACGQCHFRGIAVDEESRRGAMDSYCDRHIGYRITEKELQSLQAAIENCPDPSNIACECRSHCSVKQILAWGDSLSGGNWHDWFRMEPG